jgi:hypothetical protein
MERIKKRTSSIPRRILVVSALLTLALMLAAAIAQANVNGFEASDGNQTCETATDWACLSLPIARVDDASGTSDDIFTSGSKELQPDSWGITTGAPVNKGDIQALWSAVANNADDSSYLYLSFKRLNGTGQGFFSFELSQVRSTWTNGAGTTIPCRTNGDVLVSFEVPSTGSQANLTLYKWAADAGNPGPASCPDGKSGQWTQFAMATDQSEGSINASGAIDTNILSGPLGGATFAAGTFGEAAIDLPGIATDLGFTKTCEFFQGLSAHSRSALSITSQMQDVVTAVPLLVPACKPPSGGGTPTPPNTPTISSQQAACNPSSTVTVSGTADPGDQVLIKEGTTTVGLGDADPSTGGWSADVPGASDGSHTYTAQAVDGDGDTSALAAPISVFVDATPDAATTIATPADGSTLGGDSVTLGGAAEPGATVTVQEGQSALGTTVADGAGAWSLALSGVVIGPHTYTASASDGCNASPSIATVSVQAPNGGTGGGSNPGGGGTPPGDGTGTPGVSGSAASSNPATPAELRPNLAISGAPASCALAKFSSYVPDRHRQLARVVFKVDGKVVATVRKRDKVNQFVAVIDPTRMRVGAHKLTATLIYKGHRKAKTVTQRFRHCDKCQSRRSFHIHVAKLHDDKVVSAAVYVNGKRVKVVRGKRLSAPVVLKGLPKGAFKVVIRATTAKGRVLTSTRTYHTCVATKLTGKGKPKL